MGDSFGSFDPSQDVRSTPLRVGLSYASLVNGGYPVSSQLVQRVEDRDGHVLFESARLNGREKQALDGKVAFVTRELLAVSPYSELPMDLQKDLPQTTSTFGRSVDGRDVWFVGLVPSAVSILWLGSEHGRISIDMPTEKAKTLSHTFWQQTGTALQNTKGGSRQRFRPPVGVSYLRLPGSQGQGVNIPMLAGTESLGGESSL
jgi:membrane peptidoglycan carboxypeptidase